MKKTISLEEAIERDLGPIGTPERDAFEAEVKKKVDVLEGRFTDDSDISNLKAGNNLKS